MAAEADGLREAGEAATALAGAFAQLDEVLGGIGFDKLASTLHTATTAMATLQAGMAALSAEVIIAAAPFAALAVAALALTAALQSSTSTLYAAFETVASVAKTAADSLRSMTDRAKTWVEKLSPSAVEQFERRLASLQATLGVAFEPVFRVMAQTFDRIAAALLPVMERLRPVVERLAQSLGDAFVAAAQAAAALLQALMPVIILLADGLRALATLLTPVFQVLGAAVRTLAAYLGADATKGFEGVVKAAKWLGDQFLLLAARVAVAFGAMGFIPNLIESLKPAQGAGKEAVAKNSAISGFEEIAREMARASVLAGGAGGGSKLEDNSDAMVKALLNIQAGNDSLGKEAKAFITLAMEYMRYKLASVATNKIGGFAAQASNPLSVLKLLF